MVAGITSPGRLDLRLPFLGQLVPPLGKAPAMPEISVDEHCRPGSACGRQTSVTAGTVMHRTKLPLTAWFWAVSYCRITVYLVQSQAFDPSDTGLSPKSSYWTQVTIQHFPS